MLDLLFAGQTVLAQAKAGVPGPMEQIGTMIIPLGIIFFIFYLLIWRPQGKQRDAHQAALNALKVDDEVVTAGGILGKIRSIDEQVITLEISKGTKMRILRRNILGLEGSIVGSDEAEDDKKEK